MTQTTENIVSNNSIVVCVFIATGMYLMSRCLAMIRGHGKLANSSWTVEAVFSAAQPKTQCAWTRDLEDLNSGPTILAFRVQGWHTTNKMISKGGVDSSSSEQEPVVGYRIQSNDLLGFIKCRTFLITWRITSQLLKNNCAPCSRFIVLVIFLSYIHKQYFQLLVHMAA
jgi:hypothetical protein